MKAMIFCAGLGTRLKPLTDFVPKALVKLNDKPLLELTINKLIKSGFDEIIINVYHFAEQIIDFVKSKNYFGIRIEFSDESEMLLDTGGGLKKAASFFDDNQPFLLHNVDIFSGVNLSELYEFHLKNNSLATLVVKQRETSRNLLFSNEMRLVGWISFSTGEMKLSTFSVSELTPFAFSGIHVVNPEFLPMITKTGSFSIIDVYLQLARQNLIKGLCDNSFWFDLGKKENLQTAEAFISEASDLQV